VLGYLTLVAAGLLFGVTMLLMHAFENGVPWPHWFTKHHHEHNDHDITKNINDKESRPWI